MRATQEHRDVELLLLRTQGHIRNARMRGIGDADANLDAMRIVWDALHDYRVDQATFKIGPLEGTVMY